MDFLVWLLMFGLIALFSYSILTKRRLDAIIKQAYEDLSRVQRESAKVLDEARRSGGRGKRSGGGDKGVERPE